MKNTHHLIKYDKLNRYHQFDNFIEDESNRIAQSLAKSVATGNRHNFLDILIICGKTGTGKTHLAEAIVNKLNSNYHKKLFSRCETFIENMITSVRKNCRAKLPNFYLKHDILIIDDIQILEQKEISQGMLNEIITRYSIEKKIIVLTSNVHPKNLKYFDEGLLSILTKSVIVSLHMPSPKTKIEILTNQVREYNLSIPTIVLEELAKDESTSIRELQGNLNTLVAKASVLGKPITVEFFKEHLGSEINSL